MTAHAVLWGESYNRQPSAAAWQRSLGARWTIEEVWKRCGVQVHLPPPGRVALVNTQPCRPGALRGLERRLRRRAGLSILRYAGEGNWRWRGSTAVLVRRWRRVYQMFHSQRVKLAWTVSGRACENGGEVWRTWPGARYVDMVGWSEFAWGRQYPWRRVAAACYSLFHPLRRPLIIPEVGVASSLPAAWRAGWVRDARRWAERRHIKAVVYMNANPGPDWRLSGAAARAWGAWGRSAT